MGREWLGRRGKLLGAFLALSASACASTPFRGPEAGGKAWLEASSDHFKLSTSQSESDARDALEELEQTHAVFQQVAFPSTENPPGITEIVVLPADDFDALAFASGIPKWWAAYCEGARGGVQPRLIVRGDLGEAALQVFQHELTHRFVAFHFPNSPVWLNEGLAKFWETLDIKAGTAYFGGALRTSQTPTPFRELISLNGPEFYGEDETTSAEHYVSASALVRVLYFEHRSVLNTYLNALKSGQTSQADAWQRATESSEVEGDYAHFFSAHGTQGEIAAPQVEPRIDVSPIAESDVHVLWASLYPWKPTTNAAVAKELDIALRLQPDSVDALVMQSFAALGSGKHDVAAAALERALRVAPMRAKVLTAALRYSMQTGKELRVPKAHVAKRMTKLRLTPPQLITLALYLGDTQQVDEAIRLTARAVRLDSSCFDCYAVGSSLFELRGDWQAAVAAFRTAMLLASDRVSDQDRAHLRELEAKLAKHSSTD